MLVHCCYCCFAAEHARHQRVHQSCAYGDALGFPATRAHGSHPRGVPPSCSACHVMHTVSRPTNIRSLLSHPQPLRTCGTCRSVTTFTPEYIRSRAQAVPTETRRRPAGAMGTLSRRGAHGVISSRHHSSPQENKQENDNYSSRGRVLWHTSCGVYSPCSGSASAAAAGKPTGAAWRSGAQW